MQVEGVNEKRCQENIKNDARNHAKINGKTMMDLCSTSDAKIIGKMSKFEAEREPTHEQLYAIMHPKKEAKTYVEQMWKNIPKPGGPGFQILPNPPYFLLHSRLLRQRKPWTVPVWLP